MLIYEVNLLVDGDAEEEMAIWPKAHVRAMLAFDRRFAPDRHVLHEQDRLNR